MNGPAWRAMRGEDVDGVVAVAAVAFPDHFEDRICFAERLALFPRGCFVLEEGGRVQGYCIAYPWPLGAIPPLNSLLGEVPAGCAAWYLHDLALLPAARGRGNVRPVLELLIAAARQDRAEQIALVSVNRSVPFWRSMQFEPVENDADIAAKLASYGPDAAYMVRAV